jgi:hypothetical protein
MRFSAVRRNSRNSIYEWWDKSHPKWDKSHPLWPVGNSIYMDHVVLLNLAEHVWQHVADDRGIEMIGIHKSLCCWIYSYTNF